MDQLFEQKAELKGDDVLELETQTLRVGLFGKNMIDFGKRNRIYFLGHDARSSWLILNEFERISPRLGRLLEEGYHGDGLYDLEFGSCSEDNIGRDFFRSVLDFKELTAVDPEEESLDQFLSQCPKFPAVVFPEQMPLKEHAVASVKGYVCRSRSKPVGREKDGVRVRDSVRLFHGSERLVEVTSFRTAPRGEDLSQFIEHEGKFAVAHRFQVEPFGVEWKGECLDSMCFIEICNPKYQLWLDAVPLDGTIRGAFALYRTIEYDELYTRKLSYLHAKVSQSKEGQAYCAWFPATMLSGKIQFPYVALPDPDEKETVATLRKKGHPLPTVFRNRVSILVRIGIRKIYVVWKIALLFEYLHKEVEAPKTNCMTDFLNCEIWTPEKLAEITEYMLHSRPLNVCLGVMQYKEGRSSQFYQVIEYNTDPNFTYPRVDPAAVSGQKRRRDFEDAKDWSSERGAKRIRLD